MALNDRAIDLIVRANIQATQPLSELVATVDRLAASLEAERQAAEEGTASEAKYAQGIKATQAALQQLLVTRGLIDDLDRRQSRVNVLQNVADQRASRLQEFQSNLSSAPTDAEVAAETRLQRSLDVTTAQLQRANSALLERKTLLEQIGVLDASLPADNSQRLNRDAANTAISGALFTGNEALTSARTGAEAFTAALQKGVIAAQQQRDALQATAAAESAATANARSAATIAAPAAVRPTLTENVQAELSPVRPSVSAGNFEATQQALAALNAAAKDGSATLDAYADHTRALNAAIGQLQKQAAIVDGFLKQKQAAEDAIKAFEAAIAESDRLRESLATASPSQVPDIQAQIVAQQRRIGSADAGTGLAGDAAKQAQALETQRAALAAIGVTAHTVAEAYVGLQRAATQAAETATVGAGAQRDALEAQAAQVAADRQAAAQQKEADAADRAAERVAAAAQKEADAAEKAAERTAAAAAKAAEAAEREAERVAAAAQREADAAEKAAERTAAAAAKAAEAAEREAERVAAAQQKIVDAFRAQVQAAQNAGDRGIIAAGPTAPSAAGQGGAVSGATTPEAAQTRLATLPGPGTGNLASLQSEVERLRVAMSAGGDSVAKYKAEFDLLDLTVKQLEIDLGAAITKAEKSQHEIISGLGAGVAAAPQTATQQVSNVLAPRSSLNVEDTSEATDKVEASLARGTLTAESYNKVMDQVFAIQRQIAQDAGLIDAFQRQSEAVTSASAAFDKANVALTRIVNEARSGTASIQDLANAEARLNASATDLSKQISQQAAIDAQLKARKIDTDSLAAETAKLVETTNRLSQAQGKASSASSTLFGLSRFQFQNLQFQLNDVVTQLSLGQGVLRTFESQAGQIFQVFDLSITQLKQFAAIGIPAAAAIGLVALALERVAQTAQASRAISAVLAGATDGAARSTTDLVALERQLERTGVAFSDAQNAAKTFLSQGLDDKRIAQFSLAARDLSQAFGTDIGDAIKQLSSIPTASADDLTKLLIQYQALTPALAAYITQQSQAGNLDLARAATIDALSNRFAAARSAAISPFTENIIDLKNAWHDLLDAMGSSDVLNGLIIVMKDLLVVITALIDGVKKLTSIGTGTGTVALGAAHAVAPGFAQVVGVIQGLTRLGSTTPGAQLATAQKQVEDIQKSILETEAKISDAFAKPAPDSGLLGSLLNKAQELRDKLAEAITARDTLLAKSPATAGPNGLPALPAGASPLPPQLGVLPAANTQVVNKTIPADLVPIIAQAAATAGVSVTDLNALYRQEAVRNADGTFQTSPTGAKGPLQVEPGTFADILNQFRSLFETLSAKIGKPLDKDAINDPNFNALAGALYFRQQTEANNNNPALGAAAYNAGPGRLASVLAGKQQLPPETAQYVANFQARPQTGNNFQAPTTGLANSANVQTDEAKNQLVQVQIQRQIDEQVNQALLGNSQDRIDQDNKIADQRKKEAAQQAAQAAQGAALDKTTQDLLAKQDQQFRDNQKAQRDREQKQIEQTADTQAASLDAALSAKDPTNADAARKVVVDRFVSIFAEYDKLVAEGVTHIGDLTIAQARAQQEKLRDAALDQASTTADKAIVDTSVKARDTDIGAVFDALKTGGVTVQQAFQQVADIIAKSGPTIKAAIDKSNADLSGQPQTAKVQAQLATNARINTQDPAALAQLDTTAIGRINDLVQARTQDLSVLTFQVQNNAKTQQEADRDSVAIYAKYNDQITTATRYLQQQIEVQHQNGQISDEVYTNLTAKLSKAGTEVDALTKSQRELLVGFDNSVISNTTRGFETISDAIGSAIAGTNTWGNVIKSAGQAFAQTAAGILKDLAEIIIKQQLLNALQAAQKEGGGIVNEGGTFLSTLFGGGTKAAAGGAGAAAAAGGSAAASSADTQLLLGGLYHGGGVVGDISDMRRPIDMSVFHGAPRFHTGLTPDEVPAILQKGETVRTKAQEAANQHAMAAAGASSPQSIRNVIVFDPDQVPNAMSNSAGERVVMSIIKRNGAAVKQLLGTQRNR